MQTHHHALPTSRLCSLEEELLGDVGVHGISSFCVVFLGLPFLEGFCCFFGGASCPTKRCFMVQPRYGSI